MHIASSRGHLDCVRYLLDARAEVDVPNDAAVGGNTPLHLAIMRHYTNVAMLLLHAGADFDLVSFFYFCLYTSASQPLRRGSHVLPKNKSNHCFRSKSLIILKNL